MKTILFISFIILLCNSYSQNPFAVSQEKNNLLNKIAEIELIKKDHDSNITVLNEKIGYVNKLIISLNKSKDSLSSIISKFNVSEKNLKSFNILKSEKILDKNSKKFASYQRQIKKEFSEYKNEEFLLGFNHFYIRKNDKSNKIISIDKFNLSNRLINKQDKLLKKGSISFLTQNDSILELYTGVNSKYLLLLKQKEELNLKIKDKDSVRLQLQNSIKIFDQNKAKVELELNELSKKIEEIDNNIRQKQQQESNYLRYQTKHINGIDIYTSPLSVQEFRNNEAIKKARTEGEWNKFIELQIPAYKYKDFDEGQGNYGLIYNYYAITDKREIAPIGFHKLNLIDLNHLKNQSVFTETKPVACYCGDGTVGNYETCQNCNYWTENQKKYNFCSNCKNKGYFITGRSKCTSCNGTKKVPSFNMSGRTFSVFPSSQSNVIFEKGLTSHLGGLHNRYSQENLLGVIKISNDECILANYQTNRHDDWSNKNFKERGYQLLICKDRTTDYNDDFEYTKIGDIEIMKTYLNVTKFRNGESIKYINDPVEWELALKNNIPAYCYYNNINDNTGCIYNIHAWNDKRGLIPTNWRSITNNDIVNLAISLGYEFTLNSSFSPLKPPKGIINKFGEFQSINEADEAYYKNLNFEIEDATYISNISYSINEYNFEHNSYNSTAKQSGYVLCVRDAQNKVEIKKNKVQEIYENQENPFGDGGFSDDVTGRFGNDSASSEGGDGSGSNCDNTPTNLNSIINQLKNNIIVTRSASASIILKIKADGSVSSVTISGLGESNVNVEKKIKEIVSRTTFTRCFGRNQNSRSYTFKISLKQD
jgi:hypothetical protein